MGRTHFSQMMSKPSLNQVCNEHIAQFICGYLFMPRRVELSVQQWRNRDEQQAGNGLLP